MTSNEMTMVALAAISILRWLQRLEGPGLILLGIADASLVPLPGGMGVLTVLLAASNQGWWPC